MSDFSQDIQDFRRFGTYNYNFDEYGNLTFDSSSENFNQVYLSIPIQDIVYNNTKIASLYDVNFKEFVPVQTNVSETSSMEDLQSQLDKATQENTSLQSQLDAVISQSNVDPTAATQQAIQQVILQLRIALKQGRVATDFSTTFPYTPIQKNNT